jgi:tetratricopeptide (TPR) repeat protein
MKESLSHLPQTTTPHLGPKTFGCATLVMFVLAVFCSHADSSAFAQDNEDDAPSSGQSFEQESVALRTALHYDPTLASPLERLVALYRKAGKLQKLVGLYQGHVGQYPNDPSGRTVLVRLLLSTGDPSAMATAEAASQQFPKSSTLHHILYTLMSAKNDPKAIEELDKAIETETRPSRKLKWVETLLPIAQLTARRDLAIKHLTAIAEIPRNAEQRLEVGRLMNRYKYYELALKLLSKKGDTPAPETMVDIELETATAEVGLDKSSLAAGRLQKLLGRLTADYWRRSDIVRRRLALVTSADERESIIAAAKKRVSASPRDEAAVLDLAQTLSALQFRREALGVLTTASREIPNSEVIEQRTLELFDRLRDERGRDEYLQERIKKHPKRADLVLMRVKSLYLLGKRSEADPMFESLIKSLSGKQQAEQVLEMARFLRRSSLTSESADLLERVVKLNPNRLDVRRELAEIRLALGQRHKVSEAFTNSVSEDAPIDEVLDLVQFMLQQKLFVEASDLLRARAKTNKTNLELRLLLISVERRMGRLSSGTRLVEECRDLADTGARYRAWIEAATSFFDEFDAIDGFMAAEQDRIEKEQGAWTDRQLERRLAFVEVASSNGFETETARLLRKDLADDLPPLMKLAIRRALIDILKNDRGQYQVVEQELNNLAQEDPRSISEYSARLALLHKEQNREDRALQFLQKIDPSQIREPSLLSSLLTAFQNRTDHQNLLNQILERLTVVNPGDRGNWERWLTVLAASGDDERLRIELRRLLSGVKELTLDESTRNLLQLYVADSYWRSISQQLAGGSQGQLSEVLPHLDAIERMARDDQQWLWMTWIRAHVLNKLGHIEARDEAITELERVLKTLTVVPTESNLRVIEPRIVFPDGVSISAARARKLLSEPLVTSKPDQVVEGSGLLPAFKAKWSWKANGTGISMLKPIGNRVVLVGEYSGEVSSVDAKTGKVLWTQESILPTWQPNQSQQQYFNGANSVSQLERAGFAVVPLSVKDAEQADRFCVGGLSNVSCFSLKNGKLLWRADVGPRAFKPGAKRPKTNMNQAAVSVFELDDKPEILTWDPTSATLALVDRITGKVVWYHVVQDASSGVTGASVALNSGASLQGRHLLVYGAKTAIIDVQLGEVVWSFEAHKLRSFPVNLDEKKKTPVAGVVPVVSMPVFTPYQQVRQVHLNQQFQHFLQSQPIQQQQIYYGPQSYPLAYPTSHQHVPSPYLSPSQSPGSNPWQFSHQRPLSLTSTAVMWAGNAQRGSVSYAELKGSRLLLFQNSQVHSVDLDLPLSTKTAAFSGFLFGMSGRVACAVGQNGTCTFTDLRTSRVISHVATDLLPAQGQNMSVPIQATTDGLLAYITGQRGIQCINTKSGEVVFHVPWPKGVKPENEATVVAAVAQPNPFGSLQGSYVQTTHNPGAFRNPTAACTLACIDNGILYTLTAADTVVALEGAPVDGR